MPSFSRTMSTMMLVLVGISSSPAAFGAYLTETVSLNETKTDLNQALAVPTFNSSLGTLQSITFSATDSLIVQGSVTNDSQSTESFLVKEDSTMTLSMGGNGIWSNDLNAQQQYTGMAPNSVTQLGPITANGDANPVVITSGSVFDSFLSSAPEAMLNLSTQTSIMTVGGGGNLTADLNSQATATITVLFEYEPAVVPEPASLAMTAMGGLVVIAAGLARRRSRSRLGR